MNVRSEPVYLIVHQIEFTKYLQALSGLMSCYRNLHVIGWKGGNLTGFGAARSAALSFADTLSYRPQRVILMDQDVVQSTKVRFFEFGPFSKVALQHKSTGVPVIGLGVGYPTRSSVDELQTVRLQTLRGEKVISDPKKEDYASPVQQAVSITAPFRGTTYSDGPYPSYMVSGGEDMLMGMELKLGKESLVEGRIVKKSLEGPQDLSNKHWTVLRANMLKTLYEAEKSIKVSWYGNIMTIEKLVSILEQITGLEKETHNTSSCIVERIILRLHKLDKAPKDISRDMFTSRPSKIVML